MNESRKWKGISDCSTSVLFVETPLQSFDPSKAIDNSVKLGHAGAKFEETNGFDVVWCQWCLGHLSDEDLVNFFKRAKKLR